MELKCIVLLSKFKIFPKPLFYTSLPAIHNITILNGLGVSGKLVDEPVWSPYTQENGDLLSIQVKYSQELWPWCGYMAVIVTVMGLINFTQSNIKSLI